MSIKAVMRLFLCCGSLMLSGASAASASEPTESDIREMYVFDALLAEKFVCEIGHILVSDQKTALELWCRIDMGEDWADLAAKYSIDPGSRNKGGMLGWRFPGDLVEPLASTLRTLKPGTVSKPLQTAYGWSLVKVVRKRPYFPQPFDNVRTQRSDTLKRVMAEIDSKTGDRAALNAAITQGARPAPVLRRLLQLGADPSSVNQHGDTPLHTVCLLGMVAEAEVLINAGAPLEAMNKDGETPLHLAARFDKTGLIAALLLKKGVAPRGVEDGSGFAPIHIAAGADNCEVVHALIKAGENPNRFSKENLTPLMYAALGNAPRSISALVTEGANPLEIWTDTSGKVPMDRTALDLLLLNESSSASAKEEAETLLRQVTADAAIQKSKASFKAYVSQDGKQQEIGNGLIQLKKKPFTLTFHVQGTNRIRVAAIDQSAAGATRGFILQRFRNYKNLNVRASIDDVSAKTLFLYSPDDPLSGHQHWSKGEDRSDFTTYKATPGGFMATRVIDTIDEVPGAEIPRASPHRGRTFSLDGQDKLHPMVLICFIDEYMGMFECAVKQQVSSEIRWLAN